MCSTAVVFLFVETVDERKFDLYIHIGYEFIVDSIIENTKMLKEKRLISFANTTKQQHTNTHTHTHTHTNI